jgi:hypothetical protein
MPGILLADELRQTGFVCLWFSPGILMLESQNDRPFSRILLCKERRRPGVKYDKVEDQHGISALLNLHHKEKLKWQLVNKVDYLELSMGWTRDPTCAQAFRVLQVLQESFNDGTLSTPSEHTSLVCLHVSLLFTRIGGPIARILQRLSEHHSLTRQRRP